MSKTTRVLELMLVQWVSPIESLMKCQLHSLCQQVQKLEAKGWVFDRRSVDGQKYVEYRVRPGSKAPAYWAGRAPMLAIEEACAA